MWLLWAVAAEYPEPFQCRFFEGWLGESHWEPDTDLTEGNGENEDRDMSKAGTYFRDMSK